ncbi:hypothetical protein [Methylocaldum sp. GT1TLB]|uniref:hypothetical protein n=1 Tax=Methylocaldum sp. GT1TLB TaxID=3438965 RepID=UPI003DA04E20
MNLYAYVGGNPVTLVDPSGLSPTEGARLSQAQIVQFQKDAFDIAIGFAAPISKVGSLVGRVVAKDGAEIFGFTRHGIDRVIGDGGKRAGTKPEAILDALKNPTKVKEGIDSQGRPFKFYQGENARVVVNPETGKVVSTNPLSGAGAN